MRLSKRIVSGAAAALLVIGGLGACSNDGDEEEVETGSAADAFDTIEEGRLTVCSDIPYPPFEYEDDGEVVGIDADIMRAIGERLDLEVTFRDTDFDGIFAALQAKRCDVVASSVSITEERKENNDFTDGYFEIHQSLLVRKADAAKYPDLASLKGRTIGVQSGTTGADYAKANAKGSSIKEFTAPDELLASLRSKGVDAVLQDYPVNAYNAETTGETQVVHVFDSAEPEKYGFVVRKGEKELLGALNEALDAIRDDGTYDDILEKYLGADAAAEEGGATSTTAGRSAGGSGVGGGSATTSAGGGGTSDGS